LILNVQINKKSKSLAEAMNIPCTRKHTIGTWVGYIYQDRPVDDCGGGE
jgi:hypothetical protein